MDSSLARMNCLSRHLDGEELNDDELDDLDLFKARKLEKKLELDLENLRTRKKSGEKIDEELLFELEVFERRRLQGELGESEHLDLELLERRRGGEELTAEESKELLDLLVELRRKSLPLNKQLDLGGAEKQEEDTPDEDREYRLGLSRRKESGEMLDEDELYEVELFEGLDFATS
jgi:hypothetical protein